jgi:hypothetical protein
MPPHRRLTPKGLEPLVRDLVDKLPPIGQIDLLEVHVSTLSSTGRTTAPNREDSTRRHTGASISRTRINYHTPPLPVSAGQTGWMSSNVPTTFSERFWWIVGTYVANTRRFSCRAQNDTLLACCNVGSVLNFRPQRAFRGSIRGEAGISGFTYRIDSQASCLLVVLIAFVAIAFSTITAVLACGGSPHDAIGFIFPTVLLLLIPFSLIWQADFGMRDETYLENWLREFAAADGDRTSLGFRSQ